MNNFIDQYLLLPNVFEPSNTNFWNDKHISMQLLEAHLNPNFEGASRTKEFINKSSLWISKTIPPTSYPELLDIGCGPGLYAERFTRAGFKVTGIDFSERSISYARESARKKKLNITYLYQNYLELITKNRFNLATMIYCDYGALSYQKRELLMRKVYDSLKSGGLFLFDVFTIKKYNNFLGKQTWEYCCNGGFWSSEEYLSFDRNCKYPNHISLEQTIVITKKVTRNYLIWNQYFTKENLIFEAEKAGFQVYEIFNNIDGERFKEYGMIMAILLKKP
ncbi:Methyltransferase domain-containing protein [Anaerovirgula multivorans]|uniref:Methyltransferase domain-containing protein n=1 Tax=Anaerovirgula multivorans TaxID=312168 RepID=A0A239J8R6_9FIRM|nr:class I SAM-dependent methyltransferase [Anaerovirgula multivorans]SNT02185.1 Methyltransferase domain-containing protein [Anaerovirgula multivorans]